MKNLDIRREIEMEGSEDVFSKAVRAGRRTYFFDVKATRANDYFLTITESRKIIGENGRFTFEKQKIHLYKEDFLKFSLGLDEVINFIKLNKPECFHSDGSAIFASDKLEDKISM